MFYILIAVPLFLFVTAIIGVGAWLLFRKTKVEIPADLGVTKKLPEVDVNKHRLLLFGAGLLLSLLLTILIIESFTREITLIQQAVEMVFEQDEILDIPITEQKPPPPPKVKAPEIVEVKEEPKEEPPIEFETEEEKPEEEFYEPAFEPEDEAVERILDIGEVAKNPEFPGGMGAFFQYIQDNFVISSRDYAEENKGTIYVKFVVEKNGSLSQVQILRGVSPGLDAESIRIMKESIKWSPARDFNGAPARVWYTVPIKIRY